MDTVFQFQCSTIDDSIILLSHFGPDKPQSPDSRRQSVLSGVSVTLSASPSYTTCLPLVALKPSPRLEIVYHFVPPDLEIYCVMHSSPSKRVLKDDNVSDFLNLNAARPDLVPEDISLALQNIGSRVRHNVMYGYATDRSSPSVPPVPHSSPMKPPISSSADSAPIFITANEALHVASSSAQSFPASSNKKRTRRATDDTTDTTSEDEVMVDATVDFLRNARLLYRPVRPLPNASIRVPAGSGAPQTATAEVAMTEDADWFAKPS